VKLWSGPAAEGKTWASSNWPLVATLILPVMMPAA
jgi:hypothetical protein